MQHHLPADASEGCEAVRQRNKNDAADAKAICEAVQRPTMRFVQIKSVEQQGHQSPCGRASI